MNLAQKAIQKVEELSGVQVTFKNSTTARLAQACEDMGRAAEPYIDEASKIAVECSTKLK